MTRSPIELSAGQLKKDIISLRGGQTPETTGSVKNGSSATFIYFCILAQVYNVSQFNLFHTFIPLAIIALNFIILTLV